MNVGDNSVGDRIDINECLFETHNYKVHAVCSNSPGAFQCAWRNEYHADITRSDINECSTETHILIIPCVTTQIKYDCHNGTGGDVYVCTDNNEFLRDSSNDNTDCTDTEVYV